MKGFELLIELEEETVLSERTATEGGHRGLDYIPGGALLGAAAARLYRDLSAEEAYTLFHSGKLRFGHALPLADGDTPAFPVPHAWHRLKGESVETGGALLPERIWNLSRDADLGDRQPQQLREGYVTADGRLVKPAHGLRMKTAIDPGTGRARTGALFGYDALAAGTRLLARVTADEGVTDEQLGRVREALTGRLLIGRSRSAEFGKARAETRPLTPFAHGTPSGDIVTLWLLSDLAPLDDHGQPSLAPKPQWLGLPEGELLVGRSHLRTRRYSPWNAYRKGPDLERQVLSQGGVLVFRLNRPLDEATRAGIESGLGAHREAGLGRVWLEPPLLTGPRPRFDGERPAPTTAPSPERPDSELIRWLERRHRQTQGRGDLLRDARQWAREYRDVLASARRLKGYGPDTPIGPSASQWGGIAAAARGKGALVTELYDERDGLCKKGAPGWRDEYHDPSSRRIRPIADWLRDALGMEPDRRLTQHLCREVQDILKQEARQ